MTENEPANRKLPTNKVSKEQMQKQQRTLIVIVVVLIVGAAFILYRNGILGGRGGEAPVEQYLKAIAARDFDSYIDTMPPAIAAVYKRDLANFGMTGEAYMTELYSDYIEEFGEDMTVDVTFNGRERPLAIYVDNFKASYLEAYGEELRISSVFEYDVTAHFSGSKSDDYIELDCFVVKTGGKWCIVGCDYQTEDANVTE